MKTNYCPQCYATVTPEDVNCSYCGLPLKKTVAGKRSALYLKALAVINIIFIILMLSAFILAIVTEQSTEVAGIMVLVWFGGMLLLSLLTCILELIFRAGTFAARIMVVFTLIFNIAMLLCLIHMVSKPPGRYRHWSNGHDMAAHQFNFICFSVDFKPLPRISPT